MPTWSLETEYIQSCNCAYGCPCNFNALPTTGNCEALLGYRVRSGTFDGTKLDGVRVGWGLWWPKAIHEGHGMGRLYIDNANPAQRKAIEQIWGGKVGGGVFQVFNSMLSKTLPPKTAKIDWTWNRHDSAFSVEGIGSVESAPIKNPVTGASWAGHVAIDTGINFKKAYVTSIKKLSLHDEGQLNFEHENVAGFVTVTKFTEKGPGSSTLP
ncbi:MAG TPA: DUF1326 domain-containing protein [Thermoplasmata archaeon]|nr:DUF1326 domain-containing protein [Thermoplasmata archaeon]